MFQYAYSRALSLQNNLEFKLNIHTFWKYKLHNYGLEYFNIVKNYASENEVPFYDSFNESKNKYINIFIDYFKKICVKINKAHHIEKQFNFDKDFLNISSWYIEWYFQTEKYFKNYEDIIRKDFEFKEPPKNIKNIEIIEKIKNSNSVAIHFRRWDYALSKNSFIWIQNNDYYKKAVNYIENKIDNPVFFFFSDDINWVKDNFKVNHECHYIDWNTGNDCHEDMRLMSLCKHNIIANSSFSWWWAWLNKNINKIVIAPEKWFQTDKINYSDVIPESWIKI